MIQAMYTSITGMKAFQDALSVTSNNIANAQTVGYKKQKAIFDDLLYQNSVGSRGDDKYAGTNPKSIGSGVRLSGIDINFANGSVTSTSGKTDVALQGSGFFLLGDANGRNPEYTRKGTFGVSTDFRVVNGEGKYVLGYGIDPATGNIDLAKDPQPIQIPMGTAVGGIKTNNATIKGNIVEGVKIDIPTFDSLGNKIVMEVTYKNDPANPNNSTYEAVVNGAVVGNGTLTFDNNGNLTNGGTATIQGINVNMSGLTRYSTGSTLKVTDVDGREAAIPTDYSISNGGYVMVTYSNGITKPIAQLAVATFPNEKGLMKTGNGNYIDGPAAGIPSLGVARQNGAGDITEKATEGSNVDLSVEFVDLMVYQKGFQGNTKVIKIADDILNDIVNLIR
ncbi:flagellar hook protein FlgE [Microbacteriaceae bacterium 4G12]